MFRIGHGYDVHRLSEDRKLVLGGVLIPYEKGLLGHSDADVLAHAATDAIFGAAALPDIGRHFPDSDPQYKDANSLLLLEQARNEVCSMGYAICNLDCTIIAEEPKLASYIDAMRQNLANALNVDISNVNVKATTEEGLGLAGAGIAAHAVCILVRQNFVGGLFF